MTKDENSELASPNFYVPEDEFDQFQEEYGAFAIALVIELAKIDTDKPSHTLTVGDNWIQLVATRPTPNKTIEEEIKRNNRDAVFYDNWPLHSRLGENSILRLFEQIEEDVKAGTVDSSLLESMIVIDSTSEDSPLDFSDCVEVVQTNYGFDAVLNNSHQTRLSVISRGFSRQRKKEMEDTADQSLTDHYYEHNEQVDAPTAITGEIVVSEADKNPDWVEHVEACSNHPMTVFARLLEMFEQLNSKSIETNYEFLLMRVIDEEENPDVTPFYNDGKKWSKPIVVRRSDETTSEMLSKMPQSIRDGSDEKYDVYSIGLNSIGSFDQMMGNVPLIGAFIVIKTEGGMCYSYPNTDYLENWQLFLDLYNQHFPSI